MIIDSHTPTARDPDLTHFPALRCVAAQLYVILNGLHLPPPLSSSHSRCSPQPRRSYMVTPSRTIDVALGCGFKAR
jgi:hypothetical protein